MLILEIFFYFFLFYYICMCGLFCYSYFKEKLEEHKDNVNSYNKIELKEYDISLYNPNTNIVSDNNEIEI
jgi:hypothetical protein